MENAKENNNVQNSTDNGELSRTPRMLPMCRGIWDRNFNCVSADETVFRFLNCFKQNNLNGYILEEDRQRFEVWWRELDTESDGRIRVRLKKADGEDRNVLIQAHKIDNEEQNVVVSITDIDVASEDYRNVFESLGDVTAYLGQLEGCEFEYYFETGQLELFKFSEMDKKPVTDPEILELAPELAETFARIKLKPDFVHEIIQGRGNDSFSIDGACIYKEYEINRIFGRIRRNNQRFDDVQEITPIENLDSFTGLWNKVASLEYLKKALEDPANHQIVLYMIDIDHFKEFNDTYGHSFGDEIIMRMAQIVKGVVKKRGIGARFGGDEFMLVLKDVGPETSIRTIAESIRTQISWSFADKIKDGKLTCTIGVSESPRNGKDFDTIFNKADRALYIGKQKGRNRYIIYKEHIHGELAEEGTVSLEEDIRKTLGIDSKITLVTRCFDRLVEEGAEAIPDVCDLLIEMFRINRVTVYSGPNLELNTYYGEKGTLIESLAVVKRPDREPNIFDSLGLCHTLFNHMQSQYYEDFHGLLQNSGIAETNIFRIGEPGNIKALVCLDRFAVDNADSRKWSDEELHMLMVLVRVIGRLLIS